MGEVEFDIIALYLLERLFKPHMSAWLMNSYHAVVDHVENAAGVLSNSVIHPVINTIEAPFSGLGAQADRIVGDASNVAHVIVLTGAWAAAGWLVWSAFGSAFPQEEQAIRNRITGVKRARPF